MPALNEVEVWLKKLTIELRFIGVCLLKRVVNGDFIIQDKSLTIDKN